MWTVSYDNRETLTAMWLDKTNFQFSISINLKDGIDIVEFAKVANGQKDEALTRHDDVSNKFLQIGAALEIELNK